MTETTEPIRKSLLPCVPPPEWEFHTVYGARTDTDGCALFPGDTGPVVVRRRVTYGDWEPVRPNCWAGEPPSDTRAATAPVPCAPTGRAALDRVRAMHQPVEGLGFDCDEDDTPGSYGEIAQVCSACGKSDEYGVRWPCATVRVIDEELRRMADEAQQQPDTETRRCGAWGGCPLPLGHNRGRADIPENHHGLRDDLFTGPAWETRDPEAEERERDIQREA